MIDTGSLDKADFLQLAPFMISLLGRIAFSQEELQGIITQGGGGEKQRHAYNLCDGSLTQGEVAKVAGINSGNFSRTVKRWEEAGILAKIGGGKEKKLIGLYRV